MELANYLLTVATRHARAVDAHEEEMKELRLREKRSKSGRHNFSLTYDDETALLKGVISWVRGKPACLKKLSSPAIGSLAYIFQAKVADDPNIEGYEIVDKLVYDPEKTINYLNSLGELKEQGWIRLIDIPGKSFTEQPPFCWLQSYIELGDTFHKEMGASQQSSRSFISNDAYLDAAFLYLQAVIHDDTSIYHVNEPATDLATYQPEDWFRRIVMAVQCSTCSLPAAGTIEKYSLSVLQHLTLVGLLGTRDGDIQYDFTDPANVSKLFAQGRVCRKQMEEHLFGEKSPLMRNRLLESNHGSFGETVQLTQLGIKSLLGKQCGKITAKEQKRRVKKNTLFDFEEPKVKKDSVQLPVSAMEAIQSLIFSESREGRVIRKSWQLSLPAACGSPTGSTVLLYGPPGTGKTLTAQYLASELSLPLLKIDAARVLSCWVGESEQNVRRIFDDYSMLQKELGIAPVLLLNEADQLLGARDAGSNSVDRMNNNMQNLFLEGLERFSGILVATTNRRDLLDEAFSRRFTYKLELSAPDRNLRIELWKSHLPLQRLAEDVDIGQLADHSLSGGEISLVIERAVRLLSYRGITTIDHKTLMDIAREELASRMKRNGPSGKIGFGAVNS
ncbi:ATP-binding protein [Pelobacter propionicus]|uniref:AAA ATPase, central domain protein n=1 Tax=Pelobacter propionicus (strain DSM 2379 / NBRC 103807 / OttBd1) TaxID=338966 RepID=A1AQ72_PELPD|nr:ATP-binding protein [Pelobacter propionicus]ABK99492.1 AAA ATPase, central domain protein [Pelobacter propionicus DSM 2379]